MSIVIIGGGQLGSRHLQACAPLSPRTRIFLVDPSPEARKNAHDRYQAVATQESPQLTTLADHAGLPNDIDLAIVATTANVRLGVIEALLTGRRVRNWLLEKVLFQDLDEYPRAAKLLSAGADRTWVNCAQRLWPFFLDLNQRFHGDPDLSLEVSGSNWGLGCNAVHNTDLAAFLWDGELTHHALLDPVISDSKRSEFKEFTGMFHTAVHQGGHVRQISYATGDAPFTFTAAHPELSMIWDVAAGTLMSRGRDTSWKWEQSTLHAPYQSVLTTSIVSDILAGSNCGLPRFAAAAEGHVGTLGALLDASARNGHDLGRICPVT